MWETEQFWGTIDFHSIFFFLQRPIVLLTLKHRFPVVQKRIKSYAYYSVVYLKLFYTW